MRKKDLQSGLKDKSHIGSGPHEVKMDRDWIKIENFLTRDIADLLYGYVLLADRRLRVLKENDIDIFYLRKLISGHNRYLFIENWILLNIYKLR